MSKHSFEAYAAPEACASPMPKPEVNKFYDDSYNDLRICRGDNVIPFKASYIDNVESMLKKQLGDPNVIDTKDVIQSKMGLDGLVDRSMPEMQQRELVKLQNSLLDGDLNGFSGALKNMSNSQTTDVADMVLHINENLKHAGANVCVQISHDGNILVGENSANKSAIKFSPDGEVVDKFITRMVPDGRLRLDGPYRGGPTMSQVFEGISDAAIRNINGLDSHAHRLWDHSDTDGLLR